MDGSGVLDASVSSEILLVFLRSAVCYFFGVCASVDLI